ncbi:MAG TPA: sulfotransferase [Burkholderiales bacterium]|nr:sulfotransferase [Burkholderiales bacterium]
MNAVAKPVAVAEPVSAVSPAAASPASPLFIIGTGRCGSTVFHELFAHHPQLSWFTRMVNLFPDRPQLNNLLLGLASVPGVGSIVRNNVSPVEGYPFWEHHFRGFREPCHDLTAQDAAPYAVASLQSMARACVTRSRPHLLCKITGWPRLGFLAAIFPQARFIHIIRDGRAVASSLMRVSFWQGWHGPDGWGLGPLSAEQNERWQRYDRSFAALAGLEWEILMDAYERAKRLVHPDRVMEIRYEQLCAEPLATFRAATEFAGLAWSRELERSIERASLRNQNDKWKQGLSAEQQATLTACIRPSLARWGYAE